MANRGPADASLPGARGRRVRSPPYVLNHHERWTLDDVRRHLEQGHPAVPRVWYPALPGRERASYRGDHDIIIGFDGDDFYYQDSINDGLPTRTISADQLMVAWTREDLPQAALAFAGPASRPSVPPPVKRPPTRTNGGRGLTARASVFALIGNNARVA